MTNAISWHLEECYSLGAGERAVAVDGMHYYFNLWETYQKNTVTGAKRRIRRLVA
jgi:hypothetical protein